MIDLLKNIFVFALTLIIMLMMFVLTAILSTVWYGGMLVGFLLVGMWLWGLVT